MGAKPLTVLWDREWLLVKLKYFFVMQSSNRIRLNISTSPKPSASPRDDPHLFEISPPDGVGRDELTFPPSTPNEPITISLSASSKQSNGDAIK